MAGFWSDLPIGHVVRLQGASSEAIALSLEPLPDDAPAIVTYHPEVEASLSSAARSILDKLEDAAVALYPAWLPTGANIDGSGGGGIAAVRALAMDVASYTDHFGPFVAYLAERALRRSEPNRHRFPVEVRATGLAKILAASYSRCHVALLIHLPESFPQRAEDLLIGACEWLTVHGGFSVWLTGRSSVGAERIRAISIKLPERIAEFVESKLATASEPPAGRAVRYPAIAGRPHPASEAERTLEAALTLCAWASGRAWNQVYQSHPLINPIVIDLCWHEERCAVEVDGPEHRGELKFEADRRRDVQLQLDGYVVLRFTNTQILSDLDAALAHISRILHTRRSEKNKHDREASWHS